MGGMVSVTHRPASPSLEIADGVVLGTAAIMVTAAGGRFKRAASPSKAVVAVLKHAAACGALWAGIVSITHNIRLIRRGRGRSRVGRIWASLDGIRGLHGNATLSGAGATQIPLEPHKSLLSPALAPRVLHNPVILTIFCTITHSNNSMIHLCPTWPSEYTLHIENIYISAKRELIYNIRHHCL